MLNYEDWGKQDIPTEWRYRERPPKGSRERKSGYFVYRLDEDDDEHYLATFQDPTYARSYVENIYLPRSKDGTRFVIRQQPEDTMVIKFMNFEGRALTTTPLGGLGRLR